MTNETPKTIRNIGLKGCIGHLSTYMLPTRNNTTLVVTQLGDGVDLLTDRLTSVAARRSSGCAKDYLRQIG